MLSFARPVLRASRLAAPLALLTLGACINVSYMPLNDPPHPLTPKAPEQVQMFSSSRPDRPYVEVAQIEVQSGSKPEEDLMARLREEAGKHGCDGLIVLGAKDSTEVFGSVSHGNGSISTAEKKGYRGSCIVYKDAPAANGAPSAAPAPAPMPAPSVAPQQPAAQL